MESSEFQLKLTQLEQEVAQLLRYIAALHESRRFGPIVLVPKDTDPSALSGIQIICP
jgi:hypothetical protein